jgi:hypothetical protein
MGIYTFYVGKIARANADNDLKHNAKENQIAAG